MSLDLYRNHITNRYFKIKNVRNDKILWQIKMKMRQSLSTLLSNFPDERIHHYDYSCPIR